MALSANTPRAFELGSINSLPVLTAVRIFEGSAVGIDAATGYARPLVAGDAFVGFAESEANNTSGASGDIRVRVRTAGEVVLAIAALAITNVEAPVYASDDGTFTLTATGNSYVGKVLRWLATGSGVISFNVPSASGSIALLTDNSGGVVDGTIADVGGAFNQATLNANFADLAAKVNAILTVNK
jgi:hypothetical protein